MGGKKIKIRVSVRRHLDLSFFQLLLDLQVCLVPFIHVPVPSSLLKQRALGYVFQQRNRHEVSIPIADLVALIKFFPLDEVVHCHKVLLGSRLADRGGSLVVGLQLPAPPVSALVLPLAASHVV